MIAYEEEEMPKLSSHQPLHLSSFIRHVNYSCGSCGYDLNLNSSNRNTTSLIDSNYGKSIKKKRERSLISFFSVDQTRFTHIQQFSFSWISFFNFQRTTTATKLLCRSCGNHLGYARTFPSRSNSWDGISDSRTFYIKLNAIQPCS